MILLCDPTHPEFTKLVAKLDAYLATTDGDEHGFYDQYNSPSTLDAAMLIHRDKDAIGCGGYRIKSAGTAEVKRMYIDEAQRGSGAADQLLAFLEKHAKDNGIQRLILETGTRQTAAVKFYKRCGYTLTANYPPYEDMENSLCFEKIL